MKTLKLRRSIYILLLVIIISSCISAKVAELSKHSDQFLEIGFKVNSIRIVDSRENVSIYPLKLPFISHPNQLIVHTPIIYPLDQETIRATISENTIDNGRTVDIKVEILQAYKEFSATFWDETERTFVELKTEVSFQNGESILSSSSAEYFIKSADAKYKRFEKLYQITLKNAVYEGLKNIKEIDSPSERKKMSQ